jgi:hypothetical protein
VVFVESESELGTEFPADFISIELAGLELVDIGIPRVLGPIFHPDDVGRFAVRRLEEEEKDLGGMFGVEGEVDPLRVQGCPQGIMSAGRKISLGQMAEFAAHEDLLRNVIIGSLDGNYPGSIARMASESK